MKKNFFKKLAFVMAFAMTVTSIAPVGTASAAAKAPSLNAKGKVILLNGDASFDFNVKNKAAGVKATWATSNKSVATVNASGVVTAKKIGKTVITAKVGKKALKATIVVKENAETVTITKAPTAAIKIGDKVDMNRTYTTVTGGKTTDITKWEVTDAKGNATITSAGIFTATAAGKYTVVASTYQSKTATVATATSAPVTITVQNNITAFKAVSSTKFNVTFASAVTATALADYTLTNVASSSKVVLKSATPSADKKSVVLESYSALVSGQTYKLAAKVDSTDMTAELAFVKGTVAKIVGSNQVVKAGSSSAIAYTVYDENGLDISADTQVSFDYTVGPVSGKSITLADGVVSFITVIFTNYTTGAQVKSNQFTVTGSNSVPATVEVYGVTQNGSVDWKNVSTAVSLGVKTEKVLVRTTNQYGSTVVAPSDGTVVKFESLDPSIVVVDAKTGILTPVSIGTGYIKIYSAFDSSVYKVVPVTVRKAPYAASIKVAAQGNGSLTGKEGQVNKAGLKIKILDQYGNLFNTNGDTAVLTLQSGTKILGSKVSGLFGTTDPATGLNRMAISNNSWTDVNLYGDGNTGSANFKVTFGDLATQYVTLSVTKENNVEVGYTLDGVKDMDIASEFTDSTDDDSYSTTIKLYSINSSNEKVRLVTTGSAITDGKIIVKNSDGDMISSASGTAIGDGAALRTTNSVTGTPGNNTIKATTGTYTVLGYVNGTLVVTKTFAVTDSGITPTVALTSNTITDGNVNTSKITDLLSYDSENYTVTGITFTSSDQSKLSNDGSNTGVNGVNLYNIKVTLQSKTGTRTYKVGVDGYIVVTN